MKADPVITQFFRREVEIPVERAVLSGSLTLPAAAHGLVIFAHGSGSSRKSSRNRFVANVLNQARFGTLLFDLLTEAEGWVDMFSREYRFNIELLAARLISVIDWAKSDLPGLKLGLFGASTGAAAALVAAAERSQDIFAVVSRGGRPDLAGPYLKNVYAPTLLLVGAEDASVIELNKEAIAQIAGEKQLILIPGATHLFEEEGALEQVALEAKRWFLLFGPSYPTKLAPCL